MRRVRQRGGQNTQTSPITASHSLNLNRMVSYAGGKYRGIGQVPVAVSSIHRVSSAFEHKCAKFVGYGDSDYARVFGL
jgi:hypothetical protein